ncbi:hypothetical protein INT43_006948 [Umbelopsis isabellina]|uniref:Uncharacterized protein n=1 Tax=Mortierella isabellina TaxID=91625 RepID=A0A8H7PX72_MORIS|nr:hypothetical protein INT43_006948 [Umbelopsis isabellina]
MLDVQLDYMAQTVCDIIPIVKPATSSSPIPELVYFIHKLTVRSHIDLRVAIVALIYLHRCKRVLPKGAVGNPGIYHVKLYDCDVKIIFLLNTAHRIFLASILVASKFSQETSLVPSAPLNNQRLCELCDGMYTLRDIGDLERSFLKIIKYRCWVSQEDIKKFLSRHRADLLL